MSARAPGTVIPFPVQAARASGLDAMTESFLGIGMQLVRIRPQEPGLAANMVDIIRPQMHRPDVQEFVRDLVARLVHAACAAPGGGPKPGTRAPRPARKARTA